MISHINSISSILGNCTHLMRKDDLTPNKIRLKMNSAKPFTMHSALSRPYGTSLPCVLSDTALYSQSSHTYLTPDDH